MLPARRTFTEFTPGTPISGTTCGQNIAKPQCGNASSTEAAFLVAVCPNQTPRLQVSIDSPGLPSVVSLHPIVPLMPASSCTSTAGAPPEIDQVIEGPGPYWIAVESTTGTCGNFGALINLQ
jgi:hypothetical protein